MQVFGCGLTRPCRGTLVLSGDTGIFPFLLVPLTDSVSPRPERHMHGLSAAILSCHCCSVLVVGWLRLLKFCLRLLGVGVSLAILWECLLLGLGRSVVSGAIYAGFLQWSNTPVQRDTRLKAVIRAYFHFCSCPLTDSVRPQHLKMFSFCSAKNFYSYYSIPPVFLICLLKPLFCH